MEALKFILGAIVVIAIGIAFSSVAFFVFWTAVILAFVYCSAVYVGKKLGLSIKNFKR